MTKAWCFTMVPFCGNGPYWLPYTLKTGKRHTHRKYIMV